MHNEDLLKTFFHQKGRLLIFTFWLPPPPSREIIVTITTQSINKFVHLLYARRKYSKISAKIFKNSMKFVTLVVLLIMMFNRKRIKCEMNETAGLQLLSKIMHWSISDECANKISAINERMIWGKDLNAITLTCQVDFNASSGAIDQILAKIKCENLRDNEFEFSSVVNVCLFSAHSIFLNLVHWSTIGQKRAAFNFLSRMSSEKPREYWANAIFCEFTFVAK